MSRAACLHGASSQMAVRVDRASLSRSQAWRQVARATEQASVRTRARWSVASHALVGKPTRRARNPRSSPSCAFPRQIPEWRFPATSTRARRSGRGLIGSFEPWLARRVVRIGHAGKAVAGGPVGVRSSTSRKPARSESSASVCDYATPILGVARGGASWRSDAAN